MGHILLLLIIVAMDQLTKWAVVSNLSLHQSIPVIPDVLRITHVENRGAAFGLLQNFQWLFIVVTLLILLLAFVYRDRIRQEPRLLQFAIIIGLGGAIGNFIDRIRLGHVIDFIEVTMTPRFPIFNLADVAIVVGVGLLILTTLFDSKRTTDGDAEEPLPKIDPEGAGGREH